MSEEEKKRELDSLLKKPFLERIDLARINELKIDLGLVKSGYTGKKRSSSYKYKKKRA